MQLFSPGWTWIEADENYQQEQSLAHPPTLFLLSGGRGQVRGILYPKKLVKGISTSKRLALTKPHQGETEVPAEGNREPESKDHCGGGFATIADLVAETANPQAS